MQSPDGAMTMDFAELMREKRLCEAEIVRRQNIENQIEHDGKKAEAEVKRLGSELQVINVHKQDLEYKMECFRAERQRLEAQHRENSSMLSTLSSKHYDLALAERQSLQECINQTDPCPNCGLSAESLKWTWVEFFDTQRVSGWRAVCPACQDDVAFFEVE